jgi:hypothetical protein
MLGSQWGWVIESLEGSWDVSRHEHIHTSCGVVPVEGEATAEGPVPVDGEFVVGLECVDEMLRIGPGEVLDAEIIDTQDEGGALGSMAPEAWGEGHGLMSVGGQFFDELVER